MSYKKEEYRPRLSEEENEIITQHRALQVECEVSGIPMNSVNHYWYKGKSFSLHVKNKGISLDTVREDMIKAEDLTEYYRTPADTRDLNYDSFFSEGVETHVQPEDYHSHNTTRLDVEGMKELLLKLDMIRKDLGLPDQK